MISNPGLPIPYYVVKSKKYIVNPKHRTPPPKVDCTQWTVDEKKEMLFFSESICYGLLCCKGFYWWVVKKGTHEPIGETDINDAYIAKYVVNNDQEWHGYPVTGLRRNDIPSSAILQILRENHLLEKKYMSNLSSGRGYV